jgi:DNA-binding winged helix-turn-helix (wHTH) protein
MISERVENSGESERLLYFFGDYCLDPAAAELRRGDARLALSPKNFQLLLELLTHDGTLLTKQELLKRLWPDSHVTEASLSRAVATVRAVLGDDPAMPLYIATVPWRGYRFIAEVRRVRRHGAGAIHAILMHGAARYPVKCGRTLLGRHSECDIVFMTETVSRHHALITVSEQGVSIEDLGSRNGTFVRGRRLVGETELHDGDEVLLGGERLIFRLDKDETTRPLLLSPEVASGARRRLSGRSARSPLRRHLNDGNAEENQESPGGRGGTDPLAEHHHRGNEGDDRLEVEK